jgi:hypothetical protein
MAAALPFQGAGDRERSRLLMPSFCALLWRGEVCNGALEQSHAVRRSRAVAVRRELIAAPIRRRAPLFGQGAFRC